MPFQRGSGASPDHLRPDLRRDIQLPDLAGNSPAKASHVLVVDDSEPCLRICQIVLEQAGHTVTAARSVPEALRALDNETPDALVCDLLLGTSGTGFDVVSAVRASEEDIFCIAVTGLATLEIREKALGTGFDEFLYKPFKPNRLVELLGRRS